MPNQYTKVRKVQLSSAQLAALSLIAAKVRVYPQSCARQMCTVVMLYDLGLISQDHRAPVLDYGIPVWVTDEGHAILRRVVEGDAMVVVR